MSTYHQTADALASPFVTAVRSDAASFACAKGIAAEVETMLRATQQVFGNDVRVVLEQDAELDNDLHLVFEAKCSGKVDEVLRKEDEWHDRSVALAPRGLPFFRLFVDIQP